MCGSIESTRAGGTLTKTKGYTRAELRRLQPVTSCTLRAAPLSEGFTVHCSGGSEMLQPHKTDDPGLYKERAKEALKAAEFGQRR